MSMNSSTSTDILQKQLDWFQDVKFGLMLHWGTYSQWGIVESWSLCPEDESWTIRTGPHAANYYEYRQAYENLKTTFNPIRFHPEQWAKAARYAGMRYLVFSTKHHDGFCMFDTRETDYRITAEDCPFHSHPCADVTRSLFEVFRESGFGIGAYFSKPDWHHQDFWWDYFPPIDRNVNYDIGRYPEKWQSFRDFTYRQIEELMIGYGRIDILWLDGCWVQPLNENLPMMGRQRQNQDIDMPRIAKMARSHQPHLLIVDRAVEGDYQDYVTPEQEVPEKPLPEAWETCLTMGNSWSYVPDDEYKSTRKLIHTLIDVVSKGGNLLLNIGPTPEGELPPVALERLKEIGDWMQVNALAIYSTNPVAPFQENNIRFTKTKDGKLNVILLDDDGAGILPEQIDIESFIPQANTNVVLLGSSIELSWIKKNAGCQILLPDAVRDRPPCEHAWVFQFIPE